VVLPPNPLYPVEVVDPQIKPDLPVVVAGGNVAVVPLDMGDAQMLKVDLTQVSIRVTPALVVTGEDFALRAWVSEWPLGASAAAEQPGFLAVSRAVNDRPGFLPLPRAPSRPFVLHTAAQTPPADALAVPAIRQRYHLNVQNLTNSSHAFVVTSTALA
jgi:hypothetical protein